MELFNELMASPRTARTRPHSRSELFDELMSERRPDSQQRALLVNAWMRSSVPKMDKAGANIHKEISKLLKKADSLVIERKWDGVFVRIYKDMYGSVFVCSKHHPIFNKRLENLLKAKLKNIPNGTRFDAELVALSKGLKQGKRVELGWFWSGELRDSRGKKTEPQFRLHIYDVTFWNGKSVTGDELKLRKEILSDAEDNTDSVGTPLVVFETLQSDNVLVVKEGTRRSVVDDFVRRHVKDERGEGFVLKRLNSKYLMDASKRSAAWVKFKPEHTNMFVAPLFVRNTPAKALKRKEPKRYIHYPAETGQKRQCHWVPPARSAGSAGSAARFERFDRGLYDRDGVLVGFIKGDSTFDKHMMERIDGKLAKRENVVALIRFDVRPEIIPDDFLYDNSLVRTQVKGKRMLRTPRPIRLLKAVDEVVADIPTHRELMDKITDVSLRFKAMVGSDLQRPVFKK